MKHYKKIKHWQDTRPSLNGKTIGFVPTMGALHDGHLSLIRKSVQENEITVISVFLNPTQFSRISDLSKYPNEFEEDLKQAEANGVSHVLSPGYEEIYPDHYIYKVSEKKLSPRFCGAHKPGHFDGVLTIVMKLLNLVQADKAYFGEKDYQQLLLVQGMVKAFFIPTEIIACPIVREKDGLAMSSRNLRLKPGQRTLATEFHKILNSSNDVNLIKNSLEEKGFDVDYVESFQGRMLAAINIDDIRLIDNVTI